MNQERVHIFKKEHGMNDETNFQQHPNSSAKRSSLHVIARALYLGKCQHLHVDPESLQTKTLTHFNIAFLFSRFKKGELNPVNRYRILGIGYSDNSCFDEFNLIHKAFFGDVLRRPYGRLIDFDALGKQYESFVKNNNINVFIEWKSVGSYSKIVSFSLMKGAPLIGRTDDMDFPSSFYANLRKYKVDENANSKAPLMKLDGLYIDNPREEKRPKGFDDCIIQQADELP